MTAWRRPIWATERATRAGSSGSFQVGLPVLTLQKPQRRVQVSPRIMEVAVPRRRHLQPARLALPEGAALDLLDRDPAGPRPRAGLVLAFARLGAGGGRRVH